MNSSEHIDWNAALDFCGLDQGAFSASTAIFIECEVEIRCEAHHSAIRVPLAPPISAAYGPDSPAGCRVRWRGRDALDRLASRGGAELTKCA